MSQVTNKVTNQVGNQAGNDQASNPVGAPVLGANVAEFTVSELAGAIKRSLEEGFGYVRLRGEISGFKGQHASGHCYFALKDDKAKIEAVVWKTTFQRLKVKPQEGLEIIAQGRVTTYPGSSKYQIVIESLEPAGIGALMALLEERKRRLAAEGLFDEARKKPRPFLPRLVGIITSPTGAVIRDMLHGFAERFPMRVIVWPVRVQGDTCAAEVAAAIAGFNALKPGGLIAVPDVLIVARGGGSLEDLMGFNEEIVVRAVAASRIPIIAAVGHETDWTLIDLIADARAPTPTKAAEWVVPKLAELAESTEKLASRLKASARRHLTVARRDFSSLARALPRLDDLLALPRQRFDACEKRLPRALLANTRAHHTRCVRLSARLRPGALRQRVSVCGREIEGLRARAAQALANRVTVRRHRLDALSQMLGSLSYQSVLQRGFALVRDSGGAMVRAAETLITGDRVEIEFRDGRVEAETKGVRLKTEPDKPAPTKPKPNPAVRPRRSGGGGQGTLF